MGHAYSIATKSRGVLAAIGVLLLLASLFIRREALPATNCTTGDLNQPGRDFRRLFADRIVLGAVLIAGLVNAALFACLAGVTFVPAGHLLQAIPAGLLPRVRLELARVMLFGFAGRLSERWSEQGILVVRRRRNHHPSRRAPAPVPVVMSRA